MQQYRVVVIGGGIVGCNILYHLALEGWSDLALCERKDLTAGATWHSSGHISCNISRPQLSRYGLYTRSQLHPLEEETEQDVGLRETGSIRLATSSDEIESYKRFANSPIGRETGATIITPSEALKLWPLMKIDNVVGALHLDTDCHLNAADLTQALAKGARNRGAKILRETEITGIEQTSNGEWQVTTPQNKIRCEHIVSATGIFARSTFKQFGIAMPSAAVSHQYLVSEAVAEVQERRRTKAPYLPILRQPDIGFNVREEGDGLFLSLYETNTEPVFVNGPPRDFGMELFPADLESIETGFEGAMARVPSLESAGIKNVIHGPMPWSPDFAPLVGPVPGKKNLWMAECMSYGVTWSGGVARALARWIVHGDPGEDVSEIDCRRFGDYATPSWADPRAVSAYQGVYGTTEKFDAPYKTPIRELLVERGARFEERRGWDCAVEYSPSESVDSPATEIELTKSGLSVHEPLPTARFLVSGENAHRFLNQHFRTKLSDEPFVLNKLFSLTPRETIEAVFDGVLVSEDTYYLIAENMPERLAYEVLRQATDNQPGIAIENQSIKDLSFILLSPNPIDDILNELKHAIGTEGVVFKRKNLGGLERWECVHAASKHVELYQKLVATPHSIAPHHIGLTAYQALQIQNGEPVFGRDYSNDMTPDGELQPWPGLIGESSKNFKRDLAYLKIDMPDGLVLLGGELMVDQDNHDLGELKSVAQNGKGNSWSAFATLNQGATDPAILVGDSKIIPSTITRKSIV